MLARQLPPPDEVRSDIRQVLIRIGQLRHTPRILGHLGPEPLSRFVHIPVDDRPLFQPKLDQVESAVAAERE
jgi:hypothetical protein